MLAGAPTPVSAGSQSVPSQTNVGSGESQHDSDLPCTDRITYFFLGRSPESLKRINNTKHIMRTKFRILITSIILVLAFVGCNNEENELDSPGVQTLGVQNVTATNATLHGKLSMPSQTASDFEFGFEISMDSVFNDISTTKIKSKYYDVNLKYSCQLDGLRPDTVYYYRAYVINQMVLYQGETKSFATDKFIGLGVQTLGAQNVTETKAMLFGILNAPNPVAIDFEYGFEISMDSAFPNESTTRFKSEYYDDHNEFSCQLQNLRHDTVYYYRAYMINQMLLYLGDSKSFTTKEGVVETGTIDRETYSVTSKINLGDEVYQTLRMGVCYSSQKETPTVEDQTVYAENFNGSDSYTIILTNVPFSTAVYYRAFVMIDGVTHYGVTKSFESKTSPYPYVDLGLSVMWASCNIGAASPEEYGNYYAWGETETKSDYSWETYKWCNGSDVTLTKYCTSGDYGTVDNKTVLEPEDDVAHVKWGGQWRMPTQAEVYELYTECTWIKAIQNGVFGFLVISNKAGYTDRSIFLPSAGYYSGTSQYELRHGYYLSSTLWIPQIPFCLQFEANDNWEYVDLSYQVMTRRSYGFCVRPVCPSSR